MRFTCLLSMLMVGAAFAAELELSVVDLASGEPIGQTDLRANVDGSLSALVTGANGVGVIPLPDAGVEYGVTLTASADGYVPTLVHWEVSKVSLPETYVMRLERGTAISGVVAYDDGEPIEGASVRLFVGAKSRGIVQPAITDLEVVTDAEGGWRSDVMPKSLAKLQVRVSPPGGTRVRSVTFSEGGEHSIAALRDGTALVEISRRYRLSGTVHDTAGEPVRGARIVAWPASATADRGSFTQSARDGSFVLENMRAERMMLSTVMDGMAPDMTATTPGPDAEPIEITLDPGQIIRGQVTSLGGDPIEGASVTPHTWLGQRVLSIEMKTDAEGRFVWDGAPEEGVVFEIRKPGYAGQLETMLFPGDTEHPIALQELLRIGGSVVDEETGEYVDSFKVYQGTYWESADDVQWSDYASDEGYKGEYELYIEAGTPAVQVRVEADGYLPELSRIYKAEEGYQRYDVRMKKGSGPSGVVRKPDGTPAAGVAVFMGPVPGRIVLKNGNSNARETKYVRADENGAFAFSPLYPEFRLAVIDEAGYVIRECTLDEDSYDLELAPPATIDGEVVIGGEPSAYERLKITFDASYNAGLEMEHGANTDPDGRFMLAGLPPGEAKIELLQNTGNQDASVDTKLVDLKRGERVRVLVGGNGRAVTGRVDFPEDLPSDFDHRSQPFMIVSVPPELPVPDDVDRNDREAFQAWYTEWLATNEGRAYRESQRVLTAEIQSDGTFRLPYLAPGDYGASWRLVARDGERLGKVDQRFSVSTGKGELDLGVIPVEAVHYVKVGDDAPLFEVASLDGAPVKLEDFRGKYVLLDFWATWCGPCIGETPNLVEVFKRFGGDGRFAMIGLSLDDRVKEPLDYTTKNEMNWTQLFLGEWSATPVPDEYGVEGIPTIMLLGPDGKVVETNLRGPGIADAVAKHLD